MTGGFRNLGAAALAVALLAGCGEQAAQQAAQQAAPQGAPQPATVGPESGYQDLAARLSEFVAAEMEHKRIPALALALTDGDRIVWARGFGEAQGFDGAQGFDEAQPGVPTDADTLFRVGSVSKLFTDIAVVAREAAGELDLDAEVSELLPGFAPAGVPEEGGVSLRRLMAHRAGLVREPPVGHYFDDTDPSLAATVESLNGVPLVFPPGRRQKYSNAGIAVVGRVLEHAAGKPFAEAVTEEVLVPLGLDSSSFSLASAPAERLAQASMWSYDGREFPAPDFPLGMAPAGSMVTSVRDLAKFMTLLAGGELPGVLDRASLAEMWRVQFPDDPEDPEPSGFGLGFNRGTLEARNAAGETTSYAVVGHGGAIYGYSTELAFLPEVGLGAVAVTNVDFTNAVASRIVRLALRGALGLRSGTEGALPRSAPLPEGLARRLHGLYESGEASGRPVGRPGFGCWPAAAAPSWKSGAPLWNFAPRIPRACSSPTRGCPSGPKSRSPKRRRPKRRRPKRSNPSASASGNSAASPTRVRLPRRRSSCLFLGEYGWDHNILFVFERDGALTVLIEWLERYPLTAASRRPEPLSLPGRGSLPGRVAPLSQGR